MAPLTQQVAKRLSALNGELRRFSGGGIDLGSLGFLGLATLAAVRLQRGHVLSPASTLLWYAAGLLACRAPVAATRPIHERVTCAYKTVRRWRP